MKAFREHLCALAAYALLTLLFTYPIVFQLSTHLPGDGGDTNVFIWNLWWVRKAVTQLHANPFWTDYIFYPEGVSLVFHTLVPFNGLLGIPLQAFASLITANNCIILLSFVLSGYGAYLLIRFLIADRLSAFLGGMIFTFCPYKFAHLLGHFNLVSTEWLPFYALALLKLTNNNRREATCPSLLCAVFLLLIALCDLYYLIYALMLTALLAVYRIRTEGFHAFRKQEGRSLATASSLFLIGFAPILVMGALELLREGPVTIRGWAGATGFQADLLAFVTPSPLHPLLGPLVRPIAGHFSGNLAEATVFAGYLPLALAVVAIAKLRATEPWVRFWSFALLVFFILSLGPFPRILGKGIKLIPLPYHLIMRTPIIGNLRVPSRFAIMVMLSLAILSAFSCRRLFSGLGSNVARALTFLLIVGTIAFEYLAIPFPTFKPVAPRIYEQIAKEPGEFTILEIPLGRTSGTLKGVGQFHSSFLYYQTVHEKKLVGGLVARAPVAKIRSLEARPLLRKILELQGENPSPDTTEDRSDHIPPDDLAALKVRYVIIHPPFDQSRVRDYVEANFAVQKISEENGVVAFRVMLQAGKSGLLLDSQPGSR